MCLNIGENCRAKRAKTDIICYKIVKKHNKFYYKTLYKNFLITIGGTYTSTFTKDKWNDHWEIERGLHSLITLQDAQILRFAETNNFLGNHNDFIIVRCSIPKGSKYYEGTFGSSYQFKSYASNCVVYD